ncbi:MAG: serine/threonine protein kinase [Rubrivivax sp.]|nr:protein kinase [Rubrivivax sp.]
MPSDAVSPPTDSASALPIGSRLGEFEVTGMLGIGGFGIVYRAFDHDLEREVAVKEYMPAMMAGRTETLHVSLRSQSDAETFALGLKSFVNEAKLLARFNHPALLKVYRFWEANGTAYMAMPVLQGRTLKQIRSTLSEPPDEAWLRGMLDPLLGAIDHLHQAGVYHRDIAPDNIQIEPDGHPVLVDFGAARRVITDKTQTLTAILKPAYAPIEQYAEVAAVKQGPWTDLYALGATLHFMLLGRPPSPATTRAVFDDVQPLAQQALPGCRPEFLAAIDWMLNPRPVDRPQSVSALREVLDGMSALPPSAALSVAAARAAAEAAPIAWDRTLVAGRAPRATSPEAASDIDLPLAGLAEPSPVALDLPLSDGSQTGGLTEDDEGTRIVPRPSAPVMATPAAAVVAEPVLEPAANGPTANRKSPLLWIGVAACALAAGAWALWPKPADPVSAAAMPASAALAASSVVEPASAPTAVVPSTAAPTTPRATPSPTTPLVASKAALAADAPSRPPSLPSPAAQPTPVAPPSGSQRQAGDAAPAATSPGSLPAVSNVPLATTAPATSPAPAALTAATSPAAAGPAAAVPAATPLTPPAASNRPAASAGPEAKCDGRNPVSYFLCMERECLRGANQDHADCRKWRAEAKPRE